MSKARLLLSGVKRMSNVVAAIPLFSIHIARDFEPIALMASAEFSSDKPIIKIIEIIDDDEDGMKLCVRLGRKKRIVPSLVVVSKLL